MDYQVWCGPAMGAFNEWARGSFLERPENRRAVVVAENLMLGAAWQLRQHVLRAQGIQLQVGLGGGAPLSSEALGKFLNS